MRIGSVVPQAVAAMGGSLADAARIARASDVRRMWETLMREGGDEYILAHTNNVFILDADDVRSPRSDHDDRKDVGGTGKGKQLIAYVDESIVAAELNARRELVKLRFLEKFGEEIDTFKIIISRGQYKKHHPFAAAEEPTGDRVPSVPLDEEERALVTQQLASLEDPTLRRAVERALVSDLEWKKGIDRFRGL